MGLRPHRGRERGRHCRRIPVRYLPLRPGGLGEGRRGCRLREEGGRTRPVPAGQQHAAWTQSAQPKPGRYPPGSDCIERLDGHVQQEQDVIVDDNFVDANATGSTIRNDLDYLSRPAPL